jgi:hypothetical protein
MERFPVILLDIGSNPVPLNAVAKSNSFFIRATQLFSVCILESVESNNLLYSVTPKDPPTGGGIDGMFDIVPSKIFQRLDNSSYTLYIESDCVIQYYGIDNILRQISISYRPENVLDAQQAQYADLLVNYRLPTFEELEPAYIGSNPADMLRRLLLDFRALMRDKGKKSGIEKFLEFIGFDPASIVVTDEWKTPSGGITLTPNTLTDVKTGNYHLLFENYETDPNNPYTDLNMPLRTITETDLTDFFKKLFYALSLANVYFTLPEQSINFFGVVSSANGPQFLSAVAITHIWYENLVYGWRGDVKIDIFEMNYLAGPHTWVAWNNVQRQTNVDKFAARTYGNSPDLIDDIYTVPRQLYADEDFTIDLDPTLLEDVFASVLHLELAGPLGYYWNYTITNRENPMIALAPANNFIFDNPDGGGLIGHDEVIVVTAANGTYDVVVTVWDLHNNKDEWTFEYVVNDVNTRLAIEAFDSSTVSEDINTLPGFFNLEIEVGGGNDDPASSGVLQIVDSLGVVALSRSIASQGDTGAVTSPTSKAPYTLVAVGVQQTPFRLKVNGTVFDIAPFDNPTPQALKYSNDDGTELVLNDGGNLETNDGLGFQLAADDTFSGFGNMAGNLYLQAWFDFQPEPAYEPLPDNAVATLDDTILGTIDLDVDSPWEASPHNGNYVLPVPSITGDDLVGYYQYPTAGLALRYLFSNGRYQPSDINKNFGMDAATDMQADFMDNWIDLISVRAQSGHTLMLRKTDELTLLKTLKNYFDVTGYVSTPDRLFITAMDIVEDQSAPQTVTPWIFITTVEAGIDLVRELFDLVFVPDGFNEEVDDASALQSIYDIPEGSGMQKARLPVNYDFPLFFRPSTLQPDFVNWPPIDPDDTWDKLPVIKSIWPRLYRVGSDQPGNQVLSLGDVFLCRFDPLFISNAKDLIWTVRNSFTKAVLFQTSDFALKYRINENTIYDIVLQFTAGSNGNWSDYTITKEALFTSFSFDLDAAAY